MSKSLLSFSPFSLLFSPSKRSPLGPTKCFFSLLPNKPFSSPSTPYPLQYDMIISRPSTRGPGPSPSPNIPHAKPTESDSSEPPPDSLSFEDWVDKKLMDRSQRKYYKKREKRMYGGADSDDEKRKRREKSEFVELKPEVVELRTLHKREEELYFYDTFALPWEKEKHYKMVYQLEKKYFPQHSLEKAFIDPGRDEENKEGKKSEEEGGKGLMFFEKELKEEGEKGKDSAEKKVEELFQGWKRGTKNTGGGGDPYLASRTAGLPNQWDSPQGTVVLVNKPKGGSLLFIGTRFI